MEFCTPLLDLYYIIMFEQRNDIFSQFQIYSSRMFCVIEEENHVRSMNSFESENFVKSCKIENFLYLLLKLRLERNESTIIRKYY